MHTILLKFSFLTTIILILVALVAILAILALASLVLLFPISVQMHASLLPIVQLKECLSNFGLKLYSKLQSRLRSNLKDFPTAQPKVVNLPLLFLLQLLARPQAFTSVGYLPGFKL